MTDNGGAIFSAAFVYDGAANTKLTPGYTILAAGFHSCRNRSGMAPIFAPRYRYCAVQAPSTPSLSITVTYRKIKRQKKTAGPDFTRPAVPVVLYL